EKDRRHPKKRHRPLPSGRLGSGVAIAAVALLLAFSLPSAFWLNMWFGVVAVAYLGINLLYSFWLKNIVLVDVLILASGFLLRAAGGAVLVESAISPWLYICLSLLALFLGFGKRRGEILLMNGNDGDTRQVLRDYSLPFIDELINLVATATLVAYSLYTFSAENLPRNHAMMLTIPFVLYGVLRYLYLIHIKGEGGAPDELVLTDRPLQLAFGLWALTAILILYLHRPPE
ncbi:MAG: UbiA family prenyltransferase, partial [Dehalococcoidia bacterium]|nr:UbiA family prenyltransferase [Dehalococcoidia bacterium]